MKKLNVILLIVLLLSGCGINTSFNGNKHEYQLVGNDQIGYFELPKGTKIEDNSDKDFPRLNAKVNRKITIDIMGYSMTNYQEAVRSTQSLLSSYVKNGGTVTPTFYTDGELYSTVLKYSDSPNVIGLVFYKINSYRSIQLIIKSSGKTIDPKDLDLEKIAKSYRLKKDDAPTTFTESKNGPSYFDHLFIGSIEFPSDILPDKKTTTFISTDGKTIITPQENQGINASLDEYDKGSTQSIESTGGKVTKRENTQIQKIEARILSGTAGKKYFSSIIYNKLGTWYSWTVESEDKETPEKLIKFIQENLLDPNEMLQKGRFN